MTCYRSVAVSLFLSASLLAVSIFGPMPSVSNRVQILEFGTSTSFAETKENTKTIIEERASDKQAAVLPVNAPPSTAEKADAKAAVGTPAAMKTADKTATVVAVASKAAAPKAKTQEARAKEIAKGTPLDYRSALTLVKYADRYDLNPSLILSVIEVESNFNQWEVGTSRDRGYMQIIPATERWLAKSFGKEIGLKYNPDRIFDPEYNIGLAAAYLNLLQENYGANYSRILSEYNRGPSNLKRYYQKHGTYSTSYSRKVLKAERDYLVYNH